MKVAFKPGTMIYPLPAVMVSCGDSPENYNIITELKPLLEIAPKDVVLDMLLTGRIYNAKEALANRLVTRVVNDDELSTTVQETVEEITTGAPLAACWHKQFVRNIASQTPISEADKAQCFACYDTEDYREGCKAFKEKRKPVFARK